jgi:hypothetical protein
MTDAGAAWYEIEASEEGHKGRKATTQEILANIMTNMQGKKIKDNRPYPPSQDTTLTLCFHAPQGTCGRDQVENHLLGCNQTHD